MSVRSLFFRACMGALVAAASAAAACSSSDNGNTPGADAGTDAPPSPSDSGNDATPAPAPDASDAGDGGAAMLHVSGSSLVDAQGHPIRLRGATIESPFSTYDDWRAGKRPDEHLNATTFAAMKSWGMNMVRIPISYAIYLTDDSTYEQYLSNAVAAANKAGLYVELALRDDARAGSPTPDVPSEDDTAFFDILGTHFKSNGMLLFDVYDSPRGATTWAEWLHGGTQLDGGVTTAGMQDFVDALRSRGATQVAIVEAPTTGDDLKDPRFSTIDAASLIQDANVVYAMHLFAGVTLSASQLDAKWGILKGKAPLLWATWGVVPNADVARCTGITPQNADSLVAQFLAAADGEGASWTAWQFAAPYLIQDWTSLTPTTFTASDGGAWTCGDTTQVVGMGADLQHWMQTHP